MTKKKVLYYFILFGMGAFGYGLIEIMWRGYTHPSMALAGGIGMPILSVIEQKFKNLKFVYRCISGGLTILSIEFMFGFIFNVWLGMHVWDYSTVPLNFKGQICFLYFTLWCFMCAPLLICADLAYTRFFGKDKPRREFTGIMSHETT